DCAPGLGVAIALHGIHWAAVTEEGRGHQLGCHRRSPSRFSRATVVQPGDTASSVTPRSISAIAPPRTQVSRWRSTIVASSTVTTIEAFDSPAATDTGKPRSAR